MPKPVTNTLRCDAPGCGRITRTNLPDADWVIDASGVWCPKHVPDTLPIEWPEI